jgi:hypothetical protein
MVGTRASHGELAMLRAEAQTLRGKGAIQPVSCYPLIRPQGYKVQIIQAAGLTFPEMPTISKGLMRFAPIRLVLNLLWLFARYH